MSNQHKRVIYSAFHDEQRYVVDKLVNNYGWDPILILCAERMRQWSREQYPKAVFVETMGLRNGNFDLKGIADQLVPIDEPLIAALAPYELFTMDLLEDSTGWNFSIKERQQYYYELLKFWNTVIVRLKPDIFISGGVPHVVTDYVLYRLCVYYGIKVLFVNIVPTFNHGDHKFHHVTVSLEDQSTTFYPLYHSNKEVILRDEIKEYLKAVKSKGGMTPPYIAYFWNNQYQQWNPKFINKWLKEGLRICKLLATGKIFAKLDVAIKKNKHSFYSPKSKLTYVEHFLLREKVRRNDKKLKELYAAFITPVDLNKKYIYYAAAFQPEAGIWTTYQDQILILDMISTTIPKDWIIYYKEHPSQFMVGGKGSCCRDKAFYERVAAYPNVRIISAQENTFQLIDGAQAVVTPAGTVGWESIVRGTPALIFSPVWYQGCKSVFKISTLKDCQDAMEKIKQGFRPDPKDIERFAESVAQVSAKDIIHGEFYALKIKQCANPQDEMARIATLFYETYQRYYSSTGEARQ